MQSVHAHQDYVIVQINEEFTRRARTAGLDDQHQLVERHIAAGGEPLRDVMRRANPSEEIILASYCPFTIAGPFKEYGPIYILADADARPASMTSLPTGEPGSYFGSPFVLRAYSHSERIVDAVLTSPHQAESALQVLLRRADVSFVLARFAAYGCYGCRIERAN